MRKLYAYFITLLYFVTRNVHCILLCNQDNPDVAGKVYLKLYKGNSSAPTYIAASLIKPETIASEIVPNQECAIYAHGFRETAKDENVQVVIKAFLDRGNVNIILIDWSEVAGDINYIKVANLVPAVGKAVAVALKKLSDKIDLSKLHTIGHSLGSHVVSALGRNLNGTINRITGLDPAFPLFYPSLCHIKPTDAKSVMILHTNGGIYGTPFNTGTIDFYANTGLGHQPGCPLIAGDLCSHQRSTKLYAESLGNPKAFPAHKCFPNPLEHTKEEVYFGEITPENLHGEYCFSTNAQRPFSKGS